MFIIFLKNDKFINTLYHKYIMVNIHKSIVFLDKNDNEIIIPKNILNLLFSERKDVPYNLFSSWIHNINSTGVIFKYVLGLGAIGILPKKDMYDVIKKCWPNYKNVEKMKMLGRNKIEYYLWVGGSIELIPINCVLYDQIFGGEGYTKDYTDIKDKTIIDAGANIGTFAIFAVKNGASYVYAFEPVSRTAFVMKQNILLNNCENKIKIIPFGLGNEEKSVIIRCEHDSDVAAYIKDTKENKFDINAKVVTIDNYLKNTKIDLIKMDTEGYENNILIGGTKLIQKNKPLLIFSAYHKPEDKILLPKTVLSINPNYKITLFTKGEEEKFICEIIGDKK